MGKCNEDDLCEFRSCGIKGKGHSLLAGHIVGHITVVSYKFFGIYLSKLNKPALPKATIETPEQSRQKKAKGTDSFIYFLVVNCRKKAMYNVYLVFKTSSYTCPPSLGL